MFGSPLSDSKMKVLKFLVDLESAADVLKYQPIITYISNYGILFSLTNEVKHSVHLYHP